MDNELKIITLPTVGKWVKIGEVYKSGGFFNALYKKYAVMERVNEDGMRDYKELYMASDDFSQPNLKSQSGELELKK